ncbi:MAG TPA: LysE family transporter [Bryobacteraceae bacterium]|nr:LysE family transporter [Bryobacteraceae bacterium]
MEAVELLVRGAAAGLAISASVGPVNVFCLSRTLASGPRAGVIAGLGAAAADTFYGAIAGFSISFVIGLLIRNEFWIRLVGGVLLVGIGAVYFFKRPVPPKRHAPAAAHSDFGAAFLLNLTNPTTVLSFLAVLTGLGMKHHREAGLTMVVVGGIFLGAMLWWIFLALVASRFRDRFNTKGMLWMNRIAGCAIGLFGIAMMILALAAK